MQVKNLLITEPEFTVLYVNTKHFYMVSINIDLSKQITSIANKGKDRLCFIQELVTISENRHTNVIATNNI